MPEQPTIAIIIPTWNGLEHLKPCLESLAGLAYPADRLEIILSDAQVKSVFVNVFGGITACDAVANGIVQAFALLESRGEAVTRPLVVRLDGNNADLGRQILTDAALPGLEQVDTMDGAARRAAELAAQGA